MRKHVTVALWGDGGDEFFAGYPTYRATLIAARLAPIVRLLPMRGVGRLIRKIAGQAETRVPLTEKITRFCLGCAAAVPHVTWRRYLQASYPAALDGPLLAPLLEPGNDPLAGYADAWHSAEGGTIDRSLIADQCYCRPADMLTKVDRTSMAYGLEVRVPLLDRRMAELAASICASALYLARGPTKAVLRGAARRLGAPEPIVTAPKRGFNVPINRSPAGALRPLAERLCGTEADVFAPFPAAGRRPRRLAPAQEPAHRPRLRHLDAADARRAPGAARSAALRCLNARWPSSCRS